MNISKATEKYEQWLSKQVALVRQDLVLKHRMMRKDAFSFLRATFYRWTQVWPDVCRELASAQSVLSVGDLHVEQFGTWRDVEGRLVWGVNDFDDSFPLSYTSDLTRLATSARLAAEVEHLTTRPSRACEAILAGYRDGLRSGGQPFVLEEKNAWLRKIAVNKLRNPVGFWNRLQHLPLMRRNVPRDALAAMKEGLPVSDAKCQVRRRISGLGSLGRPRFVILAAWQGGLVAREAKAVVPSACSWLSGSHVSTGSFYQRAIRQSIRCPDPFLRVTDRWIIRRLSPYCSRIELSSLPEKRAEDSLLYAMGWETANVHLGSDKAVRDLTRDLDRRRGNWLRKASKAMATALLQDWQDWKARH